MYETEENGTFVSFLKTGSFFFKISTKIQRTGINKNEYIILTNINDE